MFKNSINEFHYFENEKLFEFIVMFKVQLYVEIFVKLVL